MDNRRRSFLKASGAAALGVALKRTAQMAIRYFWRDPRLAPSFRSIINGGIR